MSELKHDATTHIACKYCGVVVKRPMPKGWTLARSHPYHYVCPEHFALDNRKKER